MSEKTRDKNLTRVRSPTVQQALARAHTHTHPHSSDRLGRHVRDIQSHTMRYQGQTPTLREVLCQTSKINPPQTRTHTDTHT